ncbi:GTPase [Bacillus sp. FJAT-42315]|uniref:GTPase n=1 Tax=Bacillus sp. FJAT-42315 TaxID=2014077 RepID=UPI000C247310|nr:GTPase [Bacillus sp. FJAT-42315]
MEHQKLNVAIIGQSGVGKSSLINYIFGEEVRDAGVGKPVTEQGFHEQEIVLDGIPITMYDSWGLEADNAC